MNLINYVYLATVLFVIGGAVVLTRRNAIIVFMGLLVAVIVLSILLPILQLETLAGA